MAELATREILWHALHGTGAATTPGLQQRPRCKATTLAAEGRAGEMRQDAGATRVESSQQLQARPQG